MARIRPHPFGVGLWKAMARPVSTGFKHFLLHTYKPCCACSDVINLFQKYEKILFVWDAAVHQPWVQLLFRGR